MHTKTQFFAEPEALIMLGLNEDFKKGFFLRQIFKCLSDIILIMEKDEYENEWKNSESSLRKFFDSYDLPTPSANPELKLIYKDPKRCSQKYPFAIWLLNRTANDVACFKNYLGVWAINTPDMTDDCFRLQHSRGYKKGDFLFGSYCNGWANFLEEIPTELPPINSIVLNDRHLICNTNEKTAMRYGFSGLTNLKALFSALLPKNIAIPFHIFIMCQHPKLSVADTDIIINKFVSEIKSLRSYIIDIEFVFETSLHKRALFGNFFSVGADRGFNAFDARDLEKLNGENDLGIETYLNNPFDSGDTANKRAMDKIEIISERACNVKDNPKLIPDKFENIERVRTSNLDTDHKFNNRLLINI